MIPVDQELVSKPEINQFGDCQRAVIASLLELPIEKVPHFLQLAEGDAGDFWTRIHHFASKKGYRYIQTKANAVQWWGLGEVYHEISGPSPRGNGMYHATVGRNGKIFFDPHPSREGLVGDPSEWTFGFLVKA